MCCSFYTVKAWTFFSADYHLVINPEHPLQGLGANFGTPVCMKNKSLQKEKSILFYQVVIF
jgi:hypothetical protein